jgi:DNA-binding MarR family transcriptional regulator
MPVTIHKALVQTARARKNRIRPEIDRIGLSPGQPKVLTYLSEHNECMQKDIAEALDIEPATISQILAKMEQSGLIRRMNFAERKRADRVSITDKGWEAFAQWLQICKQVDDISFRGFSQPEREQMVRYLCRMYRNLTGKDLS